LVRHKFCERGFVALNWQAAEKQHHPPATTMPAVADLNERLTVESDWFVDVVSVDRSEVDPDDCLGFDDDRDAAITHLCGAPEDAGIQLSSDGQALTFEAYGCKYFEAPAKVKIKRDPHDRPYLHVDFVHLKPDAPAGFAAAMLWRMVRACHALNIPRITLQAVGGRTMQSFQNGERVLGYYAWPRFGFDGRVQADGDAALFRQFLHFPAGVADGSVASLLDLYDRPAGRPFWLIAGTTRSLAFEVAPASRSVLTLHNYLTEKGLIGWSARSSLSGLR
jgi:hypothetical protein